MGLNASKSFLNFSTTLFNNCHCYKPFKKGCLDIKLPTYSDIRLFIFNPDEYPYIWLKYLECLNREYTRIGANSILDLKSLESSDGIPLAIVAIIDGDIIAGVRIHEPLMKVDDAFIMNEMAGGNTRLLREKIQTWLPEKVVEPKGVWIQPAHPARKIALNLMARAAVYGTLLMEARYMVYSFPKSMKKTHSELGMHQLTEVGTVPYPNDSFNTSCGFFDLQTIYDRASEENSTLLRREWAAIHQQNTAAESKSDELYQPVILDKKNSFHAMPIESMQIDDEYKKISHIDNMRQEMNVVNIGNESNTNIDGNDSRWVLYPWKKVALEILAPVDFKELQTNRNKNKITSDEQEKLSTLKIGVIGLSTGNVIAHTLAMEGLCGHLKLADFDTLEVSNLNRIPASLLDIGINKAVITARRIAELNPYMRIDVFDKGIQSSNIDKFVYDLDILIEECDSLDIKLLVREAAAKYGIPVLMSTSDLGMVDIERYDQNAKQQPFHGLIDATAEEMAGLSNQDKAGYALGIVEGGQISTRLAASMTEIGNTLETWPQLASDVTQGAAIIAAAVRRIGTNRLTPSCRARIDMDAILREAKVPSKIEKVDLKPEKPNFSGDPKADMLLAASFAPSGGNVQPWKIYWKDEQLNFEIDRQCTTALDVNWRASMVSIGAACFNAEVVAEHYGLSGKLKFFPVAKQSDLVARWYLSKKQEDNQVVAPEGLFDCLLSRTTNRAIGKKKPLTSEFIEKINDLKCQHAISLHLLTEAGELKEYAEVLAESARLRYLCKHLHKEMMAELSWPGKDSLEEGIDIRTLGLDNKDINVISVMQREDVMQQLSEWNAGHALGDYNRDRIESAAATAVIGINGQSDTDYLLGGRAMQHLWLLAEQADLAVQPVSPLFLYANNQQEIEELMQGSYVDDVYALQQKFNTLLGIDANTFPVLTLNLSYADKPEFFSLRRKP